VCKLHDIMTFPRVVCDYQHEQEIVPVVNSIMYMQELNILVTDWGVNRCVPLACIFVKRKCVQHCSGNL